MYSLLCRGTWQHSRTCRWEMLVGNKQGTKFRFRTLKTIQRLGLRRRLVYDLPRHWISRRALQKYIPDWDISHYTLFTSRSFLLYLTTRLRVMLNLPPSPGRRDVDPMDMIEEDSTKESLSSLPEVKHCVGRRTKWTVLLVPVALSLITLSTRYFSHPAVLDILVKPPPSTDWNAWSTAGLDWRLHKRHPDNSITPSSMPSPQSSSASSSSSSITSAASQTLPTIPVTSIVPTPFPQPFDNSLPQNFSSPSCSNFFVNMTSTTPFRACRPFSMLLSSSATFIQAQNNLTALNSIIWGTCNTTVSEDECVSNMAWFSSALQTECTQDLADNNVVATDTLIALKAYNLMRQAGCLADPTTNTYCYLNAVFNSNPSDLYFYQLPLGVSLPNSTTPTCSACTKGLLSMYSAGLENATQAADLSGLKLTYVSAAQLAVGQCGAAYAATTSVISGAQMRVAETGIGFALGIAVLAGWSALGVL